EIIANLDLVRVSKIDFFLLFGCCDLSPDNNSERPEWVWMASNEFVEFRLSYSEFFRRNDTEAHHFEENLCGSVHIGCRIVRLIEAFIKQCSVKFFEFWRLVPSVFASAKFTVICTKLHGVGRRNFFKN